MEELTTTVPAEEIAEPMTDGGEDMAVPEANPADRTAAEKEIDSGAKTAVSESDVALMLSDDGAMYMPVYNGEVCPIRADDREEITTLLQLGMKQRDFLPSYERLSRLAADMGAPSVKALIEDLCTRQEASMLEEAIGRYGEEGGRRVYELEKTDRQRRFEAAAREEKERLDNKAHKAAQRVADEFVQLQAEYPEYTDIRQLPRQVTNSAMINGISLLDAHNRFVLAERKRQELHAAETAAAAVQSTGSLSQGGDTPSSAMDAFLSGLHSRA